MMKFEKKGQSLKRFRSEDDGCYNHNQTKVRVNEKMMDLSDATKMKAVHKKTTALLFMGASRIKNNNSKTANTESVGPNGGTNPNCNGNAPAQASTSATQLCNQYQLMGDGTIQIRDLGPDAFNPNLERRPSRCCRRNTLIHATCVNCTMDLCEECGYSCSECEKFICRACVTLFGNRPEEAHDPLCERCQMFFA